MKRSLLAAAVSLAVLAGCTFALAQNPPAEKPPAQNPPAEKPVEEPPASPTALAGFTFTTDTVGWAVAGGQVYRTTDGGTTWQVAYDSRLPIRLTQIFRTGPGSTGLAAVGQKVCAADPCTPEAVLLTSPDGQSWRAVQPAGLEGERLNRAWPSLRFTFPTPEVGYAVRDPDMLGGFGPVEGLDRSVLKTSDGGRTWQALALPEGEVSTGGIAFASAAEGFVTTAGKAGYQIWQTRDGGTTWTSVLETQVPLHALSLYDSELGLAGGGFPAKTEMQPRQAIYQTEDGGQTWNLVYQGQEGQPFDGLWLISPSRGWATTGICTMGANMPCAGPLLFTTTAGKRWSVVPGTEHVARFAPGYPAGWYGEGEEGPVKRFQAFNP